MMADQPENLGGFVYVDSNVFIYLFEDSDSFSQRIADVFSQVSREGGRLVTSELTIAECCYKPASDGNKKLVDAYEEFFEQSGELRLVPLTGALAKQAAMIGASISLKLLDAIHFCSALEAECQLLLTADKGFKSSSKLRVIHL